MQKTKTFSIAVAAVVGAAYAALTMLLAPISYGPIQFRVSELLCILPFFMPCTVWGLFAGCAIANIMTGNIFDILFGSLATLGSALCTCGFGKLGSTRINRILGCLMPVVFNAVIVGAVITWAYDGMNIFEYPGVFVLYAAQVGLGELGVMLLLGLPLMHYLPTMKFFREVMEKTRR